MQNLLKPLSYVIARLGLFLAVVMGIAGRYWEVEADFTIGVRVSVTVHPLGWLVTAMDPVGPSWYVHASRVRDHSQGWWANLDYMESLPANTLGFDLPGAALQHDSIMTFLSLRHWFVLTAFALLNGLLWWIDRNQRSTTLDHDS